jgi:hypothetical protein
MVEGVAWSAQRVPMVVNLGFLDRITTTNFYTATGLLLLIIIIIRRRIITIAKCALEKTRIAYSVLAQDFGVDKKLILN